MIDRDRWSARPGHTDSRIQGEGFVRMHCKRHAVLHRKGYWVFMVPEACTKRPTSAFQHSEPPVLLHVGLVARRVATFADRVHAGLYRTDASKEL